MGCEEEPAFRVEAITTPTITDYRTYLQQTLRLKPNSVNRSLISLKRYFVWVVKNFSPPDYPKNEPMIPHGLSVVITAPSTFRWICPASPERHLRAAQLLGANVNGLTTAEMPEVLPRTLLSLMRDTAIPNGLDALGYGEADVPALIDGMLKQQ